jgi:hypothetical protein
VTAEIPKMVQQIGSGTASSVDMDGVNATLGVTVAAGATVCAFAAEAMTSGCVFVIFTVGAGRCVGSGRMLMRAVSFFGPAWVAEPG